MPAACPRTGPIVRSSPISRTRTSSVDLHLELDGTAGGIRAALERALRAAIRDRLLPPGTVLPSTRGLATDLGIGRGTVVNAYAQLHAEGYLDARPGGTTRV